MVIDLTHFSIHVLDVPVLASVPVFSYESQPNAKVGAMHRPACILITWNYTFKSSFIIIFKVPKIYTLFPSIFLDSNAK